jgi:2-polyprenyl-3-methyl-5-hydroxy-6-metoxy-1,4-benzoquinol methylase
MMTGMTEPGRPDDVYTHGHHDSVLRSHRWRTAENSAAYLLPHLRPGLDLLDVGCGPGTLTVDLATRLAPGGTVTGVDVADVVEAATELAQEQHVDNVRFVRGDFRTLGLTPHSYDVVHAHQVLQHLRDPVGALQEMARLARPGGLVAVRDSDYSAFAWAPAHEGLDRWLEVYLAVTRRNGAEADAGRHLLGWAHAARLTDVTYTSSTWTFATPDERAWWADLWAERTVASSFGEQAVEYGIATAGELAAIAAAWRSWAEHPDAVFLVVHGELVARC